jgi:hypothetical protein
MFLKNRVLNSIETPEGDLCVDIFIRPNGSYGFEIYRRDIETLAGWFAIGTNIDTEYSTELASHQAACKSAPWLNPNKT